MKQINILLKEDLLEHLKRLSQMVSLSSGKDVTVSEIIRKSISEYSRFGKVSINSRYENNRFEMYAEPSTDDLINRMCAEK